MSRALKLQLAGLRALKLLYEQCDGDISDVVQEEGIELEEVDALALKMTTDATPTGITDGHKANFATMLKAAKNGDLCTLDCTDVATGGTAVAICAAQRRNGQIEMVPFARMFNGNPYEELAPPAV